MPSVSSRKSKRPSRGARRRGGPTTASVEDYLEGNPTRNRPLDLLPIFLETDPDR